MATARPWLETYPNPFSFLALALPTGFPRRHKYHSVVRSLLHPATTLRPPPFARTQVLSCANCEHPTQFYPAPPSCLYHLRPIPTPALPVRELEAQEDLFANVVVRPPLPPPSSSLPSPPPPPPLPPPPAGGPVEEQGVQTHPNTLYATAYETYSKELKNSVPKPKCIPSTQVICQRLIEILADTTP
ncbi:hypothetical protein B0H14DRAFT_3486908 [Mycena olivaceomarginata]|nr:hypothetical protein B0H14DRAFT_3486908 [Mycena olivaceomarginata]